MDSQRPVSDEGAAMARTVDISSGGQMGSDTSGATSAREQ